MTYSSKTFTNYTSVAFNQKLPTHKALMTSQRAAEVAPVRSITMLPGIYGLSVRTKDINDQNLQGLQWILETLSIH